MKVAWLCPYPVDLLPRDKVQWNPDKKFHPATWLVNLSNALSKRRDIKLNIITLTPWVRKDFRFVHNDISFHILRSRYAIPLTTTGSQAILSFDRMTKFRLDGKKIKMEIENIKPEILHSHGTEFQYSELASKMSYPLVISVQGIIKFLKNNLKGSGWKLQEKMENEVFRNHCYFISKADFCSEYIKSLNNKAHIFNIDDIVSAAFFNNESCRDKNILLFVGTVIRAKGIEELLKAFEILKKKYNTLVLRIAGYIDGKYKSILNKICREKNIYDVHILGSVSGEQLLEEYLKAGIFVFPSHFETSPNVVMEAMATGLPIVTTRVGGIPDMIDDGISGFLVNAGNVSEIVEKVELILNNSSLADNLGKKAKEKALEKFTEEAVVSKTIDAYNFVLNDYENSSRN